MSPAYALKFELDRLSGFTNIQTKEDIQKDLMGRTMKVLKVQAAVEGVGTKFRKSELVEKLATSLYEKKKKEANEKKKLNTVTENKRLAMNIREGAKQLAELEINYQNGKSEYQHIIGSVPMPVNLIKKVEEENVTVNYGMMNFVVRKCYESIYKKCFDYKSKKSCIIGTPGIAKSVSLCYPLLKHFIPCVKSGDFENALPVVLHHPESDGAFIWHQGSAWQVKKFMQSDLTNCVEDYPDLLYLVDGAPVGKTWISYPAGPIKIQVTSPSGNYREEHKQYLKLIMPCWKVDELRDSRVLINDKIDVDTLDKRIEL